MAYHQLEVWQKACDLAVNVYRVTGGGAMARDYGLKDQMQRAAVSIPSNIAEGEARESLKDTIRFLFIARGSSAELCTQLWISERIGYLTQSEAVVLRESAEEVARMIRGLIRSKAREVSS